MLTFEKILLGILSAAPAAAPIFIHSERGIAIFNASEALVAGIAAQFAPAPAAQTTGNITSAAPANK
jgi:hypothetical protein